MREGDPEVLLIRRAARRGDPWTGHIALPGGHREVTDADDCAAAAREAQEEVGFDLSADGDASVVRAGNLPQRVVMPLSGMGREP